MTRKPSQILIVRLLGKSCTSLSICGGADVADSVKTSYRHNAFCCLAVCERKGGMHTAILLGDLFMQISAEPTRPCGLKKMQCNHRSLLHSLYRSAVIWQPTPFRPWQAAGPNIVVVLTHSPMRILHLHAFKAITRHLVPCAEERVLQRSLCS